MARGSHRETDRDDRRSATGAELTDDDLWAVFCVAALAAYLLLAGVLTVLNA